jgi:3D-(3,5/4)-trihydroxycyclohexane-1,2-dione acylhydrolase (decyclizing)
VGAVGSTGSTAANRLAAEADVVIGVGTRWSDFSTASRTAYRADGVTFVNVNVAAVDTAKHAGVAVVADAREALTALTGALAGWTVPSGHRELAGRLAAEWDATVQHAYDLGHGPLPAQSEVIGAVNAGTGPKDVLVCAAGSMPGDLHKLWRTRDPKGYHVEYGYSCMGYEIAGGLGVAMAIRDSGELDRRAVVMVGDGSYLMMAQELVTAVQERVDLLVVLVQNQGFASIGELSENLGSQRFGTRYRFRDGDSGRLDGDVLPVDLAANAQSLGVRVLRASGIDDFRAKLAEARGHTGGPVLVHVETDPLVTAPSSESWWDVPVSEVSQVDSTRQARKSYEAAKAAQRPYLESRG